MTNNMELFEKATKEKYRFAYKGVLTVEDLWDLRVEELDTIFKGLNAQAKQSAEESLLAQKSSNDTKLQNMIEIVKHIVAYKIALKTKNEQAMLKRQQQSKILEIIEAKQDEKLQNMSLEELQAMLKE